MRPDSAHNIDLQEHGENLIERFSVPENMCFEQAVVKKHPNRVPALQLNENTRLPLQPHSDQESLVTTVSLNEL